MSWLFGMVLLTIFIIGVQTKDLSERANFNIDNENRWSFMCFTGASRLIDAYLPRPSTLSVEKLTIDRCDPTNSSYFVELQALNVNVSSIKMLDLIFNIESPLPQGNYTEGLPIKALNINNLNEYHEYILQNVQNFLEPLTNLEYLSATSVQLPSLPKSARLLALNLNYQATIKDWGNCQYLETLKIKYYKGPFPQWPQNCKKLISLTIQSVSEYKIGIMMESMMPAAAHSLRVLKIVKSFLKALPIGILTYAKNLVNLDLSNNRLKSTEISSFPKCANLKTLDLRGNSIYLKDLKHLVPKLPGLRKIRLGSFRDINSLCDSPDTFAPLQNWSIEFIQLINVDFDFSCISSLNFKNLKEIEMADNRDTSYSTYDKMEEMPLENIDLKLTDLPRTRTGTLKVALDVKRLKKFLFDKTDFKSLEGEISSSLWNKRNNLRVYTKHPISCDCEHGWLARALREFPNKISMPRLLCYHGENSSIPLLDEPPERIECDKTEDEYCIYRKSWRDGTVVAECQKEAWNKVELPQNLYGLNISGRGINTLRSKLPDKLQWLDLRRNAISFGNAEEAAALFAAGRRVWLADNSLLCDCDNRALLNAIQQNRDQIEDYDLLNCAGTDEAISKISTALLCQTVYIATTISLGVCGVLAVIAGLIALLLRRYGEQISMFLYSRGWFVSCLQKHDPYDKPFDAFLSFAHEDQEYVTETLLPGLENAPEQFRICVHYRDWPIGDWIPAQIMRSVQLSKRTLIVLSRNFVASAWSTLEFRYSLANTTEDPNVKVLVLIKDDVLDMDLDKDLRRHLTFNTYLHCDDPWFWEKLRYAMPHRVKKKQLEEDIDAGVKPEVIVIEKSDVALAFPNSSGNL